MNFNFYIFGNPGGGYDQYPNDYSTDLFRIFTDGIVGTRCMIYRRGDLMHYAVGMELSETCFVGCCVIFNGAKVKYSKNLFNFLRSLVEKHAFGKERLLSFTSEGEIVYNVSGFSEEVKTYDYLRSLVNASFEGSNRFGIEELTSKYHGDTRTKYLTFDEPNDSINDIAEKFGRVILDDNERSGLDNELAKTITELNTHIAQRDERIKKLEESYSALERKKTQYRKLVVVAMLAVVASVGFFIVYNKLGKSKTMLGDRQQQLYEAQTNNSEKNKQIAELNRQIENLTVQRNDLSYKVSELENENDNYRSEIDDCRSEIENLEERNSDLLLKVNMYEDWNRSMYRYY